MSTAGDSIKVTGLRELQAALRATGDDAQKELRVVLNQAADLVVNAARPKVPSLTGRARASLRTSSTQREARITGGNARASYYGWLDFGGRVGPRKSIRRSFIKNGRYLYASYAQRKPQIEELLATQLVELAEAHGLVVKDGG